jgi:PAS domain S-box-containing protein
LDRKNLLSRRFTSFVMPEDQDRWTQLFLSVKTDGGQVSRELTLQRRDGTVFHGQLDCTRKEISAGYATIRVVLSDITARKQAEEALMKAGALQSAIFNSANFSSIATDANGVIQIFNVGAERMLGYAAADVMNKITPADISDPQEVVARAKALSTEIGTPITPGFEALVFKATRGIEDIYELTYIRKDGSRFPAVVSVTALRDAQDVIIGYLLIGTDNTARKRVEDEQKQLGQRLRDYQFYTRSLFEANIDALMTTDPLGIISDVNQQMMALTGRTRDELIGAPCRDFFTDPVRADAAIKRVLTENKVSDYELTVRAANGEETVVSYNAATFHNRDRKLQGVFAAARDVTASKKAETQLLESEARTKAILAAAVDAMIIIDASGTIESLNTAAEKLFGYTALDMVGQNVKMLMPAPYKAEHDGYLHNYTTTGVKKIIGIGREVVGLRKNGETFQMDLAVSEVQTGGRRLFTGIVRDITERKRMDQALHEKNAELENARSVADKANLAKSDFLSSMSHELRTPLSAILGFAQLMEAGSPPPTPSQKKSIMQILKAGWFLLELINEILDLATIESGKLALLLEPISLTEVVRECQTMIEPQAQKRGISVTFPQFEIAYFVKADRTRVKQILINLLSNATKYNKAGGTVVMDFNPDTPGRIRICVKDSGEGLTSEQIANLFQPFNRLGKETGREEGTGIGLVVCKRLIELMGGVIGVESTVGKGSVFWIELTLTAEPQPGAGAVEPEPTVVAQAQVQADAQLHTLLYVEDNPANLMLVKGIISRRPDIRLLSAIDGSRGIEIARASRPDVILMDINLPGISGIQALILLRADPATAHIPVMALSANAMPQDIEKGLAAGFFRYLTKPIKVNELLTTLDVALNFAETQSARANEEVKP